MNIGAAARASGLSAKMIRYYEMVGLLLPAERSQGGYRVYGEEDVHALRFINHAREFGFSIEETGALLSLWRDKSRASAAVKLLATQHVRDLEAKIAALEAMVSSLRRLADSCHGDTRPDCPILEDLVAPKQRTSASIDRRQFAREFKMEALARLSAGHDASRLARDLGMRRELLHRWRRQYEAGGEAALDDSAELQQARPGDRAQNRIAALEQTIDEQQAELMSLRSAVAKLRQGGRR